ncbi:UDP-N-acetylmuramoyl-L-alanyl-D-glutamate--2,6-diaminopimelate ligase [Candidatus Ishikawella capsulata]|uniref:UDP-N-acetylmuramoyl-L-alanyl-D-glutamate--2,6-diaminopimelate ligase n=1 Tax=Candidatus Ishikawaella capsulata Mpkobe TaxID=476281 RepID=C5WD47_9ENTR|nr:UDP-N-acetylmuramoyl-L-alanyl-D-glutamate--2,6-diaminopimelate ligase [Candidatus Ishikawaella capsulata]BAH83253.1 UDP-N-acetylmuramoylalanyl-D-glutamate--2,6-diaminopimelate ligase [Candidatus Ishikawaella capsulata Mpkobe]
MHNLKYLLAPWVVVLLEKKVLGIKEDSRQIKPGDLFVAIPGYHTDGRFFIDKAIAKGASAVLAETEKKNLDGSIYYRDNVPVIYLQKLSHIICEIASRFYDYPAKKLELVGITGTNGKTTISHLIAQLVNLLGGRGAVMGTLGNGLYNELLPTKNTTSSAIEIQNIFNFLLKKGANVVAMEVSSHGILEHRVSGMSFTAAVFTNLSRDHLDYHGNIKQYELAKWQLFAKNNINQVIFNIDDKVGLKWSQYIPDAITVSIENNIKHEHMNRWLTATKISHHDLGSYIKFNSSWGSGEFSIKLIGLFNVINVLLAFTTLLSLNYPIKQLINCVSYLKSIPGRMEVFKAVNKPTVIVDYAHTPDALSKALTAVRLHYCKGNIWCLFGCGGDRDKGKRPLMGRIAEKLSDRVVISDDNPRTELSQNIIDDILTGLVLPHKALIIPNRFQAIKHMIRNAKNEDILLIAGKGHENYQIFGKHRITYSDRLTVAHLLEIPI